MYSIRYIARGRVAPAAFVDGQEERMYQMASLFLMVTVLTLLAPVSCAPCLLSRLIKLCLDKKCPKQLSCSFFCGVRCWIGSVVLFTRCYCKNGLTSDPDPTKNL
jgi:hypothetical protein